MKLSESVFKFNNQAFSHPWSVNSINSLRVKGILSLVGTGKKVLDVGCYDGTISKEIEDQGNSVVGIDISPNAIELAKKNGVKAYVYNIEEDKLPVSFGKFDAVVAGEIIEHIFDPDSFIKKLSQVLKPKGVVVLTTPNLAGIGSRLSLLMGKLPWMIENDVLSGKSGHIRYFTKTELEKLLNRQGFKMVQFKTDSVGFNRTTFPILDRFFPSFGRILIVKAQKK